MRLPDWLTEDRLREILKSAQLDSSEIETVIRADEAESVEVERCDFRAKIGNVKKTDEGYLQGSAAVARVGILTYYLPGGTTRRELVTEQCLFDQASMDSLKLKPMTDTHPTELVTSKTAGRKKVGYTGESIQRTDDFLTTSLVITDAEAVQSVANGRNELSPGYRADILMKPGVFNGQRYDAIQVRRVYNHVALCDMARGGRDLKINLDGNVAVFDGFAMNEDVVLTAEERNNLPDSAFAIVIGRGENKVRKLPIHDKAHIRAALSRLSQASLSPEEKAKALARIKARAEKLGIEINADSVEDIDTVLKRDGDIFSTSIRRSRFMNRITLDGIDYEADQQVINHLRSVESARADGQKKLDEMKVELDRVTAERDTLKTKNDELTTAAKDETALKARVDARLRLVAVANENLDEETLKKLDSMSDQDIRKAVILKRFPDAQAKLDDANTSAEYILARFDSAVEALTSEKKTDNLAGQRQQAAPRNDGKDTPRGTDQARTDMIRRLRGEKVDSDK